MLKVNIIRLLKPRLLKYLFHTYLPLLVFVSLSCEPVSEKSEDTGIPYKTVMVDPITGDSTLYNGMLNTRSNCVTPIKDGKKHGEFYCTHMNGNKKVEGSYLEDEKNGKWTYYYSNGKKRGELVFFHDLAVSDRIEYDSSENVTYYQFVDNHELIRFEVDYVTNSVWGLPLFLMGSVPVIYEGEPVTFSCYIGHPPKYEFTITDVVMYHDESSTEQSIGVDFLENSSTVYGGAYISNILIEDPGVYSLEYFTELKDLESGNVRFDTTVYTLDVQGH